MALDIRQISVEQVAPHVFIGRMKVNVSGVEITLTLGEAVCEQIMTLSEPLARSTFFQLAEDANVE